MNHILLFSLSIILTNASTLQTVSAQDENSVDHTENASVDDKNTAPEATVSGHEIPVNDKSEVETSGDLHALYQALKQGVPNGPLLLPGKCSVSNISFEDGFLRLTLEKDLMGIKTEARISIPSPERFEKFHQSLKEIDTNSKSDTASDYKYSFKNYSHWGRPVKELKFKMDAKVPGGSFYKSQYYEHLRILFDPKTNEIIHISWKGSSPINPVTGQAILCEK